MHVSTRVFNLIRHPSGLASAVLVCGGLAAAQPNTTSGDDAQSRCIAIPVTSNSHVVVDGTFAEHEWDDAMHVQLSENCQLYLLADSENLYVAFRLGEAFGEAVSEVYFTSNEKEFYTLHSSGALGEGVNRFSDDLTKPSFSLGTNDGWESNVGKRGEASAGKEFRISLGKLAGASVRFAGGIMAVSRSRRESANFPSDYDLSSADGWVELILPAARQD
jgi:hypothetical protein